MFYKHWKKIALALTGFFWVSCDSDATSANGEGQSSGDSSDSGKIFSSDSEKIPMSDNERVGQSSSSGVKNNLSSGEMELPIALYGVPNDVASCFLDLSDSTVVCDGSITCKMQIEESWESEYKCIDDICPEYGVVLVSDTTYECDGKTYNEAEFRSKYNVTGVYDPSKEPVVCNESDENTVTCWDGITYTVTTDEKGNKTYTAQDGLTLSEKEFEKKYVIQKEEYAPLYGISW
ncbi:MAG: hypothetical protein IJ896_14880 [Fibrobacter sp.]|nr:hypothetical protein [Fibrobacter sp.]